MLPMDKGGGGDDLSANILSNSLSHLLTDPPRPLSALPQTVSIIIDRKPFASIASNSPILQKWNTRMSSLLQSKNIETRYWGVCLVKATISNEGEGINHAVVWAKLLTSLLNVSESLTFLTLAA
jgi:rRNA processing/ribosome biogenesis